MMDSLLKRIEKNRKAHIRWLAMVLCLSMIVSLGTFAGFRQKAVAKTYTKEVLDCPYTHEGAEPVAHVHNDDCYDGETLVCTLPEREAHTHTDECFAEQRRLTCGLEENPGHQHGDACYAAREVNVCGLEENPGHKHNGTCYNESGALICTLAEGDGAHTHTADCFTTVYDLICEIPEGEGAHTHTEECYTTERVQVCGKAELPVHVHGPECIRTVEWTEGEDEPVVTDEPEENTVPEMPVSDPNADVETASDWEHDFDGMELSGNWARDLVLVAATQQGRGESPNNFEAVLNDAGDAWVRHGYTRYGAWYGVPYAEEWSAMFVSFCLRYAGIPEENVPNNPTAAFMAESFSNGELFAGRDYVPAVGDLIFFDSVDDEITNIDHMGIVYHVDAEDGTINTVEGDRTNAVATFGYRMDDEQIIGYGILPQNPDYIPTEENLNDETSGLIVMTTEEKKETEETTDTEATPVPAADMPAQSWERTAGGIKVLVEAPEGAFPENTRIAVTPVNGNSLKDTVSDAVNGEVLEVQAVDITFFDAEGHEIEPAVPIRVVMTPAATQHAEEKTSVVHVDVAQQTAELIEQTAGTELDNSEVVFDADAFTIYAIVYTYQVEYEYEVDGKTFTSSMPGAENMTLTQIVEGLGIVDEAEIDTFVSKIASIASSNEEVAVVNENNEIRVLKDGEAKIVITMQDGAKFHIDVRAEGETSASNETATVSTVGELYLPTGAELKAEVLDEVKSESAIAVVEAQEGTPDSNAAAAETAYQVFDISLENVEADQYNGFQVEVKLPENLVGRDFRLFHIHDGETTEINLNTISRPADDTGLEVVSGFTFETKDFSEFVLKYTVDFEYNVNGRVYKYSLNGGDRIDLSELIKKLRVLDGTNFADISTFMKEIEDVVFSDDSLINVYKATDAADWVLDTVQPFSTHETLTITMKNGDVIIVSVTDAQPITQNPDGLKALLDSVSLTMNGTAVTNNSSVGAKDGDTFTLALQFTENDNWQFVDDATEMVYQLPEGVTLGPDAFNGKFVLDMGLDGILSDNIYTYDPATRQIKFKWNTNSPNFEALTDADNASFKITVTGQFDFTTQHIEFKDDYSFTITHEDPHNADIEKSGQYYAANSADNPYQEPAIKYTVVLKSEGETSNLQVRDTVSGSAVSLIAGSASVSSNKNNSTFGNVSLTDKSMSLDIGSMQNGEEITITYWGRVNLDGIAQSGNATVTETGNTVKVEHDNGKDEDTNVVHEIKYSDFSKAAKNVSDSFYDEASGKTYQRITWEIVTNSEFGKSLAGSTITDKIAESSKDRMSYSGQGITVNVYDSDNNLVDERNPSWSEIGVNNVTGDNKDITWTYRIPSTDGNYKYVITYTTDYDITGMSEKTNATNYSEGQGGTDVGTAQVGPGEQDQLSVLKKAVSVDDEKITWNITINIPPNTEYNEFWVTDKFPNIEYNSIGYIDTFDSVTVSGLTGDETWEWEYTYPSSARNATVYGDKVDLPSGIKVIFTKDGMNPGINKSNENRTITVKVTTKNDPDWMNLAKTDSNSWVARHENSANVFDKGDSDTAYPMAKQVFKSRNGNTDSGKEDATVTIGGVTYPLYRFQISLAGVYETPITVTDTFDTNLFEFYTDPSDTNRQTQFYGGTERSYPQLKKGEITATPTATGVTFTAESIPMNGDVPYGYYGIWYWLKPKNEAALEAMRDAAMASENGKAIYINTASFGDSTDTSELEYDYKIVDKTGQNNNDGTVNYKIELNKDKLQLNGGNNMTMSDTYSANLSIDFGSIEVTTDPADKKSLISWDFRRNTGTFVIPDETHVIITYKARIIGESGTTQTYDNTAYMNGYFDTDKGSYQVQSSGEGSATNYRIRLFKFGEGHMETGLNNVTFRLLDADKQPVVSPKTGLPVTFTTGTVYLNSNGVVVTNASLIAQYETMSESELKAEGITKRDGFVQIMLSQARDGVALKKEVVYYLQEVEAPAGYETDYVQYSFAISDNPDYSPAGIDGVYVYHNNDVMTVRNWPESSSLRIVKQFAGNAANQLTDEQKAQVKFTITKRNETTGEYEPFNVTVYRDGEELQTNIVTYADKKNAKGDNLFQSGVMTIELETSQAGTYRVEESNYIVDTNGIVTRNTYKVDGTDTSGNANPGEVTVKPEDFDENNPTGHTVEITNTYFTGYYDFTKYDNSTGSLLGGATFGVFKAADNTKIGDDIVTDVDQDAKFTIKKGDGRNYEDNVLYYVVETAAPNGYVLPDPAPKYYFFFSADKNNPWSPEGLPDGAKAIDLTTDFASEFIANGTPVDEDELKVEKEWKDKTSGETISAGTSSVDVTLKRYTMVNPLKTVSIKIHGYDNGDNNTITFDPVRVQAGRSVKISWMDDWGPGSWNDAVVYGFDKEKIQVVPKDYQGINNITIPNIQNDINLFIDNKHRIKTEEGTYSAEVIDGSSGSSTGDLVRTEDNDFSKQYTLNAGNSWSHTWSVSDDPRATGDVLPKTDSNGNDYYYYVVESPVENYDTTYDPSNTGLKEGTLKVVNLGTEGKGSVKVTKQVTLNGQPIDEVTSADKKKLADGTYTFTVTSGEGITPAITKYIQVTVTDGKMASYKVSDADTETAWTSAASKELADEKWAVLTDLPAGSYTIEEKTPTNGTVISKINDQPTTAYRTTVKVVAGDTTAAKAFAVFTNDYATTSATVKKVWDNNGKTIPDQITVTLMKNGEVTDPAKTVTLSDANEWTGTIQNLPKYQNGEEIQYSWKEDAVPGYRLSGEDKNATLTTLTNTYETYDLETSYVGTKTWSDQNNQYKTRPENLTVILQRKIDTDTKWTDLTLTPTWTNKNSDTWTYTFEHLPVFDDNGNVYRYQAREESPEGYSGSSSITDTNYALGTITWKNGHDRTTPDNKVIWTLNTTTDLAFVAIAPTAHGNCAVWTHRVATPAERAEIKKELDEGALPPAEGRAIDYYSGTGASVYTPHGNISVTFDPATKTVTLSFGATKVWSQFIVGQFETTQEQKYNPGATDFTNSLDTTELKGQKTWAISGTEIPENPILTLTRTVTTIEGEGAETNTPAPTEPAEVEENETGKEVKTEQIVDPQPTPVWSGDGKTRIFTYSGLPKYDKDGNPYTYSVSEASFTVKINGATVTYTVTKDEKGDYVATTSSENAPKFKVTQEGSDITNTELKSFEFSKIWKQLNGNSEAWPNGKTITVTLNAKAGTEEKALDDVELTFGKNQDSKWTIPDGWTKVENDDGSVTFRTDGLDARNESGEELTYYVVEKQIDGYTATYGNEHGGTSGAFDKGTITNSPMSGYELPQTGGIGTTLFTALGGLMTATAGAILTMKSYRRRKENA